MRLPALQREKGTMAELEKLPSQNVQTYTGFLKVTVVAIVLIAIVLIGMALFLA